MCVPFRAGLWNRAAHGIPHHPIAILEAERHDTHFSSYSGPKIKLVIFDLDGTLIDSERDLAAAVNAMLVKYGRKELPIDVIGTYIGDGAPMLIRRALGDPADREFLQEALNYFLLYYREHKLDSTYIYDGMTEALQQIAGSDGATRRMAVLTNKPVRVSRDIVAGLGLSGSFFQVYGGNSFETKKPDPLGANTLMQEAGVGGGRNRNGRRLASRYSDRAQCRACGAWA